MLGLCVGLPTKIEESVTTRSGLIIDFKENQYPNDAEWREHIKTYANKNHETYHFSVCRQHGKKMVTKDWKLKPLDF